MREDGVGWEEYFEVSFFVLTVEVLHEEVVTGFLIVFVDLNDWRKLILVRARLGEGAAQSVGVAGLGDFRLSDVEKIFSFAFLSFELFEDCL